MATEQQRQLDAHKARLDRIQSKAFQPAATVRPGSVSMVEPVRVPETSASVTGCYLTVRDIQDAVIEYFGMARVELFAKRRDKTVIRRRHIAIYLSKTLTTQTMPEIGMRFGGLDHTTILYASRKVEREMPTDEALARDVTNIRGRLEALNDSRASERAA